VFFRFEAEDLYGDEADVVSGSGSEDVDLGDAYFEYTLNFREDFTGVDSGQFQIFSAG
jgi:hypothetical protein